MHVSMTTDVNVALHFARMACSCDDEDEGGLVVLCVDSDVLESAGFELFEFESDVFGPGACEHENEVACLNEIPFFL